MTDQAPPQGVAFIDNPHAPEVFAEGAAGFLLLNGNVRITLTAPRADYASNAINRVVLARLVLPIGGAEGLAVGLFNFLKQHGIIVRFDPLSFAADQQLRARPR